MSERVRGALERAGLVLLGTALLWLASPPGPAPALVFVADAPFLLLLWHRGGVRWKRWAWLYGVARFAAGLPWLAVVGWPQYVGSVLLLSTTYLAWGGVLRFALARGAPFLLTVATTAVLQEMAQAYLVVKGGMPWPARSLATTAFDGLVGFASVFGAWGLSFLAALSSAWASGLPSLLRAGPLRAALARRLVLTGLAVALCLVAANLRGRLRISAVDAAIASGEIVRTRPLLIVQGNVAQTLKHSDVPEDSNVVLERHERQTVLGLADLRDKRLEPIAVFWPETMVPWPFLDPALARRFPEAWADQAMVVRRLAHLAPEGDPPPRYLLGVNALLEGRGGPKDALGDHESRDSVVWIEIPKDLPLDGPLPPPPEPPATAPRWEKGRQDKRVLVPFAEWTPLLGGIDAVKRWKERVTMIPELTPGDADEEPFLLDLLAPRREGGANRPVLAGSIVCFEVAYPAACRSWHARGARVLLNAGNYGWFGETRMPHEVLALARLRAAECAVTVAIAGNTGPSAIVDPAGRVDTLLEKDGKTHHFEGFVWGPLYADVEGDTGYARWGEWPVAVLVAYLLLGLALETRRRRRAAGAASAGGSPPGSEPPPERENPTTP